MEQRNKGLRERILLVRDRIESTIVFFELQWIEIYQFRPQPVFHVEGVSHFIIQSHQVFDGMLEAQIAHQNLLDGLLKRFEPVS